MIIMFDKTQFLPFDQTNVVMDLPPGGTKVLG